MTVSAQTPRSGPYSGNGSTTAFDYGFFVKTDDEIVVTVADAAGAETVKTLTTDYTVSGAGNATGVGGTVTFVTAPVSTERVVVMRTIAMTQAVDLQNRKSVVPAVLESAYDKLTRITQDHKEQLSRSVQVDIFGATDVAALTANINIIAGISVSVVAVAGIADDVSLNAANIVAIQGAAAAAVAAGDSATGAATTLASFEQLYLGAKSSAPTVDNAGGALITGAQYFNDVSNSPFIWTGSAWSPAVFDTAGAALNSENLSGLASKSAARTNLELGTAAQSATGDFATAAQGAKADAAAPKASPTFTGVPAVPTATVGTSTTQAASTAFVQTAFAPNFDGVVAYPASNLTYSFATHGLGAKPTYVHVTMQCKVATGGFAVGDEMPLAVDDSSGRNFSVVFDGTVCGFGRAGDAFYVRRDAAAAAQFNATNWEIRVRCWL
jgi:hypothetical protein